MNPIVRAIAHNLGFDEFGQLVVIWHEPDSSATYSAIIADMRDKTCPICGNGWQVTADSFRNQFLDRGLTDRWCHKRCYEGYSGKAEADMWYTILCNSEDRKDFIPLECKELPNGYGGGWNTPWYLVTFLGYVPKLKMGRRRRVYSMRLLDLRREQVERFEVLFKDEDVTKEANTSDVLVHAWSRDKAAQYVAKFVEIIRMDPPKPGSRAAVLLAEMEERIKENSKAVAAAIVADIPIP